MEKERSSVFKKLSLRALLFSFLFLVSIVVFVLLAHEVAGETEHWFDTKAFTYLDRHSSPAIISFFKALTFLGSPWFLLCGYCALILFLLIKRRKEDAADIAIIGITSTVLLFVLKGLFARTRPDLPLVHLATNYSFPSGHALSSFIFFSVLIFSIYKSHWRKAWKYSVSVLLLLFAILIGLSRIALRYHYASDVVAGFCIGFSWLLFSFYIQRKLKIFSR
jgi:membrane-associated phospholipid phosphatase